MTTFNKLAGASSLKKEAPPEELRPLSEAVDRIGTNLREMARPNRLAKAACVAHIHEAGAAIRRDLDVVAEIVAGIGPMLAKRDAESRRAFLCGRQSPALDANDPATLQMIGDAVRANPRLLDKFAKPN